jgi:phosphate transport system substrate-binding protein
MESMMPAAIATLLRWFAAGCLALPVMPSIVEAARAADAENGARVFRRCAACHEVEEPVNRIGPHLIGVVGRTAGTVPGFNYSTALAGSGIVWTEANLDAFLADPRGFVPGNRMLFAGVDDPEDRADLIAFLGGVEEPPTPEPEPEPEPSEPVEVVAVGAIAPLLEAVAARFGAAAGQVEPNVLQTIDSDAIARFCGDVGAQVVDYDLLGLARRIRQSELDGCAADGVDVVTEIKLGYEGLVLATGREQPQRDVDLAELWLAFTGLVPSDDGLVPSSLQRWPEISPEQPDGALPQLLGMPGDRQLTALGELGLSRGCLAFPAVEASRLRATVCTGPRRLRTIELAESEIPTALQTGAIDLALMTLAGFEAGRAALEPFRIDGVEPSVASVRDGSYALAQPLYLYVTQARHPGQAGIEAYLAALTAEEGIGAGGDLGALGLVPLTAAEREAAREAARTLPALTLGGRNLLPIPAIAPSNPVWAWASAAEMVLRSAGLPALGGLGNYRCNVVAARFGSCEPDCAGCLNPVVTARSLVRALDAYQEEAVALRLIDAPALASEAAPRLKSGALRRMIRSGRSPILAQVLPQGRRSFYPAGMTSHFALIVGIAGTGKQALLTVNDAYPYPEALNPYLATGARTGEPGQYTISYDDFRQRLGYRQSVVLDSAERASSR